MKQVRLDPSRVAELAALMSKAEPSSIVLEPGEYRVGQLAPRAPITIAGRAGAEETIIRPSAPGGTLFCIGFGTATLRGLTIADGSAHGGGGIMATNDARLFVDQCLFERNDASVSGGAICADNTAEVEIVRCRFRGNRSKRGGAVAAGAKSRVRVDRCMFVENEASHGGSIYVGDEAIVDIISSSFFHNKTSEPKGGGTLFVTGMRRRGPQVSFRNGLVVGGAPLVNNPQRPGAVTVAHALLPPNALADSAMNDGGHNHQVQADLVDLGGGLWAIRPEATGSGDADVAAIAKGALDLLGRPMVVDGKADPGALASPTTAGQVAQYTSIEG